MPTTNLNLDRHASGSAQSNNAVINNNWDKLDAAIGKTIGRGILADRPASGQFEGATYWVTDQDGIAAYTWDGSAWQTLLGAAGFGTLSNRPASAPDGWIYIPSDVSDVVLYVFDGGAWVSKSGGGGGGSSSAAGLSVLSGGDESNPYMSTEDLKANLTAYASQAGFRNAAWINKFDTDPNSTSGSFERTPAIVAQDGMVYAMTNHAYRHDLEQWDPSTNSWTQIVADPFGASFETEFVDLAATITDSGNLVFYGQDGANEQGFWYNPKDGTSGTESLADTHVRLCPVKGGFIGIVDRTKIVKYDDEWTVTGASVTIPNGDWCRSLCILPNGKIMLAPEYNAGTGNFHIFNPVAMTFESCAQPATYDQGYRTNGVPLPDGTIAWIPSASATAMQIYDIDADSWTESAGTLPTLGTTNKALSTCLMPSGEVFILDIQDSSSFTIYDYKTGLFRRNSGMVWDMSSGSTGYQARSWRILPDGRLIGCGGIATSAGNGSTPFIVLDLGFAPIGIAQSASCLLMGAY